MLHLMFTMSHGWFKKGLRECHPSGGRSGVFPATRAALMDYADSQTSVCQGANTYDAYSKYWLFNAGIECFQLFINKYEAKSKF